MRQLAGAGNTRKPAQVIAPPTQRPKGRTTVHFLGDLCLGVGVLGILEVILALTDMEKYGAKVITVGVVMAVVGLALMAVLHKRAKKSAEAAFLRALAQQERS